MYGMYGMVLGVKQRYEASYTTTGALEDEAAAAVAAPQTSLTAAPRGPEPASPASPPTGREGAHEVQ